MKEPRRDHCIAPATAPAARPCSTPSSLASARNLVRSDTGSASAGLAETQAVLRRAVNDARDRDSWAAPANGLRGPSPKPSIPSKAEPPPPPDADRPPQCSG